MADTKPALSRRGELARNKLKKAATAVIERVDYNQMKVTDITKEAEVATGLFYHYFPDLKTLMLEVMTDFLQHFEDFKGESGIEGDWYKRILSHARMLVDSYGRHPGIMRCLLFFSDQDPEFGELYRASTSRQITGLAKLLPKIFPDAEMSEQEALFVVYSLGGTMESLLREYYISKNSVLCASHYSCEQMAELLSVMFYRGLFLRHPCADSIGQFSQRLERVDANHCAPGLEF